MKTFSAKPTDVTRTWYIIDAANKPLGRVASQAAAILRGKHKAMYTPHEDTGDPVIITNVEQALMTGNKAKDKMYYRHTGYPGGLVETSYEKLLEKHPTRPMSLAIKGMLPKNSLGRAMFSKLKVYAGAEHPHAAQQPVVLEVLK